MNIPIVIFHVGNQSYFNKCVLLNSKNNFVYVIGDSSNENLFLENNNVFHIHVDQLKDNNENSKMNEFIKHFINYSSSSYSYELNCFLRIFYLKKLLLLKNLQRVFHVDSDCVILDNVNSIFKESNINVAYSIVKHQNAYNPYHMAASIHNALLNNDFCDAFVELCDDIYINKSKFYLIEPKINWHKENNIAGGICDMTLYYLLDSEKIIENVVDLNEIYLFNGEECVFDNQVSSNYGYLGTNTYQLHEYKHIYDNNGKKYFLTVDDKLIRSLSIHFQGGYKYLLDTFEI
jgi:hypothetical protein